MSDRHTLFRRTIWTFVDQAVSSGSNFILSVLVLSLVPAFEFAVFAVCLTTYLFAVQLARATVGVPVTLFYTRSDRGDLLDRDEERAAIGAGVALGVLAALAALVGSAVASQGRAQLVVLGAALPFLIWQDMVRYVCFARGRPSVAAGADTVWLTLQLAGSTAVLATGRASAATLLGVWAAAGAISAVAFGVGLRLLPRVAAATGWLWRNRALCGRLLAEFTVAAGSHYCVYYGLAIVAGADQLGRLKAAQTILGPVIVLLLGGGVLGVPESVRAAHDPALVRRIALRLSALLASASIAWGIIAYVALPIIGPAVFPNAWATARPLLPMLTLFAAAFGASLGATGALRAFGASPWLLRSRTISGVMLAVLGIPLSARFQAIGALLALALAEGSFAVLAWRRLVLLTKVSTSVGADDSGRSGSDTANRRLPRADEAGPDALRPGGGAPSAVMLEGLGPDPTGELGAVPEGPTGPLRQP